MTLHRPPPDDADIALARITRTRVGTRYQAWLTLTALLPEPTPRHEGRLTVCHLGWRALSDRSLRVAVVGTETPPPTTVRDVARGSAPGLWEIIVPAAWRDLNDRNRRLQSIRDTSLDATRKWLIDWLTEHPAAADAIDTSAEAIAHWRSAPRFAALTRRLRVWLDRQDDRPDGLDDALLAELYQPLVEELPRWITTSRSRRCVTGHIP